MLAAPVHPREAFPEDAEQLLVYGENGDQEYSRYLASPMVVLRSTAKVFRCCSLKRRPAKP